MCGSQSFRPAAEDGQAGQGKAGKQDAKESGRDLAKRMAERAQAQQRPAYGDRGEHEGDRGQAEELHDKVGNNCAGHAEDVADRGVGGKAEARIVDAPGHQAGNQGGGSDENRRAGSGKTITAKDLPEGAEGRKIIAGRAEAHGHGSAGVC